MKQQGMSLLELLVALAVLVITATIAIPAMAEFINHQRATSYVRQLNYHLAYARVAAASSHQPVQLCPLQGNDCIANWQQQPLQLRQLVTATNSSVLLREIPAIHQEHRLNYNREALTFRRDGSLDGFENGTFYYCPQQHYSWHYRLTINQAGRSRLTYLAEACPG